MSVFIFSCNKKYINMLYNIILFIFNANQEIKEFKNVKND